MIQFVKAYLPALAGLPLGVLAGLVLGAGRRRLPDWDARVTVPLLLAAATAHLALLPAVEPLRVVLFSLYALALLATIAIGLAGAAIWRVGAVALPAGSILAYAYFAALAHEADVIGLLVKAVELLAIAAALVPWLRPQPARGRFTTT